MIKKTTKQPNKKPPKAVKLSRLQAPANLSPIEWQRALRKQFGREQSYTFENIGEESFFSEFKVSNPTSKRHYRIAIRGEQVGANFCDCPDYASNALGTCKHIEFMLAQLQQKKGAKAAFKRGFQPAFSELYLRHDGVRTLYLRLGTDCPPALQKIAKQFCGADAGGQIAPHRFQKLDELISKFNHASHELRFYEDARAFVAGCRDAAHRLATLEAIFPQGDKPNPLKNLLKIPLYPYQAEGAIFAVRAGRALIGDEMGLGKTIQAIAAMEIFAQHFGVAKVLVIAPTSLKYQWQSEIARFSGRSARIMVGGMSKRAQAFAEDDFCKITNYEKLRPDLAAIEKWAPDLVIVDEAQRVKNWNTIAAQALKQIDSPYAIVLTGTPLENKLEELISIVQFVDQHRLGATWKLLYEHQQKDADGRVTGYVGLDKIGETLKPVMIRRRKSEVLMQLPERTDQTLLVPMTEKQMEVHQENANVVVKIVQRWRRMKFLTESDQRRLTCSLQNMRMVCNSTYLLDQESDHGVKADELAALFDELFQQSNAKAVVFSQWTRTQEIIIRRLTARGIGFVRFHGGIPSDKRPALIQRFHEDADCRVFLSTDAGASGLNLQNAAMVVNMDLPWNPALLEQRIGRLHRIGQKQTVQVVNFVAKGSIEEGMLSVLAFKRSLSAGILDGGQSDIALGGSRLTNFMKEVEKVTGNMGEGEAMNGAEEAQAQSVSTDLPNAEPEQAPSTNDLPQNPATTPPDPWLAIAQFGEQLLSTLIAAPTSSAKGAQPPQHPWVEHDPATGAKSLKIPLPPAETAKKLAELLSRFAQSVAK